MKTKSTLSKGSAVISAIGKDQPGIVAAVARVLYEAGCNLEDSSMTILGGEFAIILIVTLPMELELDELDHRFNSVRRALRLTVFLKAVGSREVQRKPVAGNPYMISVYGVDQAGIVYQVAELLAKDKVNITDVNTRRIVQGSSPIYMMMIEVEFPKGLRPDSLKRRLEELGRRLSVTVTLHPIETPTL